MSAAGEGTGVRGQPEPDLSRDQELHRLVSGWRLRLDAYQVPALAAMMAAGIRQRRRQVSQQEIANLIGGSGNWYGALERGNVGEGYRYSSEFLDRVAFALGLSEAERRVLYLHAAGQTPPVTGNPDPPTISAALMATLHTQPWPAWISDPAWNILELNGAAVQWFPHMRWERNVMAYVYKYEGSRHQLVNWESVWAPRMLMQVRAALAVFPEHTALTAVAEDILQSNNWARQWWDSHPDVLLHPDGDRRQLYLPNHQEPTEVEIVATTPMRNPDLRLVSVVPVGGSVPQLCREWVLGADEKTNPSAVATALPSGGLAFPGRQVPADRDRHRSSRQ